MNDAIADDRTLPEIRAALAPFFPGEAAFDGWTDAALAAAARAADVPIDRARLAIPGGAVEMIDLWFAEIDHAMCARLTPETLVPLRIRDRIALLVWTRIDLVAPHREALRRALAILALPSNVATAARLGWRAADTMWRAAGDRSTDLAFYSKRATLAGVYATTLLAMLDDESEGWADTRTFLDRRIDNVMRLERVKARLRTPSERRFQVTRFLGRLRYPAN